MKSTAVRLVLASTIVLSLGMLGGCPPSPTPRDCNVEFCKQVDHYEAGYGAPGVDTITVECVRGPAASPRRRAYR